MVTGIGLIFRIVQLSVSPIKKASGGKLPFSLTQLWTSSSRPNDRIFRVRPSSQQQPSPTSSVECSNHACQHSLHVACAGLLC